MHPIGVLFGKVFWDSPSAIPDRDFVWNKNAQSEVPIGVSFGNYLLGSRSSIPDRDFIWIKEKFIISGCLVENGFWGPDRGQSRLKSRFWLVCLLPIGTSYSDRIKNLNGENYSLALNAIRFLLKNWLFWRGGTSKSGIFFWNIDFKFICPSLIMQNLDFDSVYSVLLGYTFLLFVWRYDSMLVIRRIYLEKPSQWDPN